MNDHPTRGIIDSTKLQSYMTCPRQYFYEYVLGWRPEATSNHLIFGDAIHQALEHLYNSGDFSRAGVANAFNRFLVAYREHFPEDTDTMFWPKTPAVALGALMEYADRFAPDLDIYEVKYTEVSGSVPIATDRMLHFRLDMILRHPHTDQYFVMEHKTGSSVWGWEDQWTLKTQTNAYLHVLHCLYPTIEVGNVIVNGIIFKKNKTNTIDFVRIPLMRTVEHLEQWLITANTWMDFMEEDYNELAASAAEDHVLKAFPMNSESCMKYGKCAYHTFCCTWSNPLRVAQERGCPIGYRIEHWDPSARDSRTKVDFTSGTITIHTTP